MTPIFSPVGAKYLAMIALSTAVASLVLAMNATVLYREKSKDAPRPTTGENKEGGMLATTHGDEPAGAGLGACDDTDGTVSGSGERWMSDSGATENMTPDPLVSEDTRLQPWGAQWRWAKGHSCRWPATETFV